MPFAILTRRLKMVPDGTLLAARITGQGLVADLMGTGQALRREWWPIGLACALTAPRSRAARLGVALMLTPIALEWAKERPPVNPFAYAALRLLDDAAYGSGVISSSLRKRTPGPLLPAIQGVAGLRMVRVRSAVSTPWTRSRLVTLTDE